jgi:putative flippase GtrA
MPDPHPAFIQFVRYVLAGGVATAAQITLFHLIAWKLLPSLQPHDHAVRLLDLKIREVDDYIRARNSMLGNAIAFLFSNLVAYLINVLWVFDRGRHSLLVEVVLFYLVSAISMAIGTVLMGLLIRRHHLLTTFAFGANLAAAVMINYVMRKYLIFLG